MKRYLFQKEFEILIEQLVAKTIVCCGQALKDSGLEKKTLQGW